ncbi:MAG: FmdB family zinc ribbon protein [Gammaproteobacteria bacterium]
MPIYEYECSACHHRSEAMQALSDAPLSECPECRQASLRRLVSAAGFRLKGTGWYVTDFRNKGVKPAEKSGAEAGDKKAAGEGGKTGGEKSDAAAAASSSTSESKPPAAPAE